MLREDILYSRSAIRVVLTCREWMFQLKQIRCWVTLSMLTWVFWKRSWRQTFVHNLTENSGTDFVVVIVQHVWFTLRNNTVQLLLKKCSITIDNENNNWFYGLTFQRFGGSPRSLQIFFAHSSSYAPNDRLKIDFTYALWAIKLTNSIRLSEFS